jgi:cell division protein FtsQ
MSRRRARSGWAKALLFSAALVSLIAIWLITPDVLSGVEAFRVRRIELVGLRHLSPDALIRALRLDSDASVFVDRELLADRLKGVRGVVDARVERRLPATLRVVVREAEPVAFTPASAGRGLAVLDDAGRELPFDPARSALDLPVAQSADAGVAAVLGLVRSVDPELFRAVLGARSGTAGAVILELAGARILFDPGARPDDIKAVVHVAQDLEARGRSYAELDARYTGQVVVRRATRRPGGKGRGA